MIYFRTINHPFGEAGFVRWQVEYYAAETGAESLFPVGWAYVVESSDSGSADLNFILVADEWRRKGIATEILKACRSRWPALHSGPATEAAAALMNRTLLGSSEKSID